MRVPGKETDSGDPSPFNHTGGGHFPLGGPPETQSEACGQGLRVQLLVIQGSDIPPQPSPCLHSGCPSTLLNLRGSCCKPIDLWFSWDQSHLGGPLGKTTWMTFANPGTG